MQKHLSRCKKAGDAGTTATALSPAADTLDMLLHAQPMPKLVMSHIGHIGHISHAHISHVKSLKMEQVWKESKQNLDRQPKSGTSACHYQYCTFGQAGGHVVLHVLVLPEPVIDVPSWQLPALLHHDPRVQKLRSGTSTSAHSGIKQRQGVQNDWYAAQTCM